MNRALILGVGSFSGRALAENLAMSKGWEVHGTYLRSSVELPLASLNELDITDDQAMSRILREIEPTHIFNLCGWATGSEPYMFYEVHGRGTLNLLMASREWAPAARTLIVGAAAEYGPKPAEELPIRETYKAVPTTHYGRSKLIQTMLARQAAAPFRLFVSTCEVASI